MRLRQVLWLVSLISLFLVIFFFSSRRRHTRCALVTGVQTCALPIYGGGIRLHAAVAGGRACHHIVSQLYPGFRLRITLHFAIELTLTETAAATQRHCRCHNIVIGASSSRHRRRRREREGFYASDRRPSLSIRRSRHGRADRDSADYVARHRPLGNSEGQSAERHAAPRLGGGGGGGGSGGDRRRLSDADRQRSEEHTSELQS